MGRTFLLMGSGEFEPWSEEVERRALDGRSGAVLILPTASAPEGDAVLPGRGELRDASGPAGL